MRGLRTKTSSCLLAASLCNYDVIVFTETFLNSEIYNNEIFNDNYIVYRCDRSSKNSCKQSGGGVLVAVSIALRSSKVTFEIDDLTNEELWICLTFDKRKLYIGDVYLPPSMPVDKYSTHIASTSEICSTIAITDAVLVLGDYNLPQVHWSKDDDNMSMFATNVLQEKEQVLLDGMAENVLSQINYVFNYNNRLLDLVFTNDMDSCSLSPAVTSFLPIDQHHPPVVVEFCFDNSFNPVKDEPAAVYNFAKADYVQINHELNNYDWETLLSCDDLNEAVDEFYKTLFECFDHHVPTFISKSKKYPLWFDKKLIKLLKRKKDLSKKLYNSNFRNVFKQVSSQAKVLNKNLYDKYLLEIQHEMRSQPKKFWSFVNSKKKTEGYPSSMIYNDNIASTPQDIVNLFAEHFNCVFTTASKISTNNNLVDTFCHLGLSEISIYDCDIVNTILKAKPSNSIGSDGLSTNIVKNCVSSLVKPLKLLFMRSLATGVFPQKWKASFVTPIFKSAARNKVINYRGVAILPSIGKSLEKIVYNSLFEFVKSRISTSQHGFFKGRSVVTNLLEFTSSSINSIEDGKQMDVVYTDFSKAFDLINHRIILKKLANFGVQSSVLNWFKSYLSSRSMVVKIGNNCSRAFYPQSGVPQGSHLGPLIFLIFINDITEQFKYVHYQLYADDMKLFMPISSIDDSNKFQEDLNSLEDWCNNNQLFLNIGKCKVMTYHRSRVSSEYNYYINNTMLERVHSMLDLGVLFDKKLSFNDHITLKISKAKAMLGFIKRITWEFKDITALKSLYYAHVRSHVEYCSCLWSPSYTSYSNRLESIQRNFTRYTIWKLNQDNCQNLSYELRLLKLNMESLNVRRKVAAVLFVADLLCSRTDAPSILQRVNINVNSYRSALRNRKFLSVQYHRTNYGKFEPINRLLSEFNESAELFDFHISRDVFKKILRDSFV